MVVKRKRKVNGEEEYYYEEEYETSFNQASNNSDNSLLLLGSLGGLAAITGMMGSLSPMELETLQSETGAITEPVNLDTFSNILSENTPNIEEAISTIQDAENLSSEELSHLTQMMEDAKQYSRMSDPKTSENLTFNNQSNIADQMGQFGYHESSTQGNLELAAQEGIMFPWVTVGDDNVCDDCLAMEEEGPYPADSYPEAQHYGDRCNEPFPDPIIALPGEVENPDAIPFDKVSDMSSVIGKVFRKA